MLIFVSETIAFSC